MSDTPDNPDSGAAGTEHQTIEALRSLGHEVEALWSDQLPRRIAHGNLHYLLELPFTYRSAMLAQLRLSSFDVVHMNQPHGYLAARTLHRQKNRPVFVHRSHGLEGRVRESEHWWSHSQRARPLPRRIASSAMAHLLAFNDRSIARHADGHIVSSSLCKEHLIRNHAVDSSRIAVIAQAAPPSFLAAPPTGRPGDLAQRILHVGQFAEVKAPFVLTSAVEAVLERNPAASFTWVCPASRHESAARLLGPLGRQRTTFLDWMPQEQLMGIYDSHGVFLFPSYFEGFGKVFLEAMSRGLVVIASREGGAVDVISDKRDGFVVPVGDAGAMAQACIRIQHDHEAFAAVGARARETAERYTWVRAAGEAVAFYQRLIDSQ